MYETLSCFKTSWNLQNICKFTFRFDFRKNQLRRSPTHQDINQQTWSCWCRWISNSKDKNVWWCVKGPKITYHLFWKTDWSRTSPSSIGLSVFLRILMWALPSCLPWNERKGLCIHVTFDIMVTELPCFFFLDNRMRSQFFWVLMWTGFFKVSSECESHVIN